MYDVIVIGGGPAGVTAALRARELGATVALVERGNLGGTCTNDGCVPTRVLAKAARLVRDAEQFGDYGLAGGVPRWISPGCWSAPRASSTRCTRRSNCWRTSRRPGFRCWPARARRSSSMRTPCRSATSRWRLRSSFSAPAAAPGGSIFLARSSRSPTATSGACGSSPTRRSSSAALPPGANLRRSWRRSERRSPS